MKNTKTNGRRPRNRVAIFYKSHGKFVGPWLGKTFSKTLVQQWQQNGDMAHVSNYVLRSPLQLRRRVT